MYYGFDMGGTKIELGVFDAELNQIWRKRVPTPRDDYRELLNTLASLTFEADEFTSAKGKVGIGIPGLPNADTGELFTSNVPAAMGKPLPRDLSQLIGRPVRVDNDANCFALSEAWDEEFRAYPIVLGIILGTGVGGGLVINGKTLTGRNYIAGEFGHFRLPVDALDRMGADTPRVACGCGQHGCIEKYISGRGFEWLYQHRTGENLGAKEIIERYRAGDDKALAHVDCFADVLAMCLGNLFTVIDPHLVVLGGGLSNFAELYPLLNERVPRALLRVAKAPRIEPARYGDAGGVRGAAFLNLTD